MFEVFNTFIVIETIRGNITIVSIVNPTNVILSMFLIVFIIILLFYLFINCLSFLL